VIEEQQAHPVVEQARSGLSLSPDTLYTANILSGVVRAAGFSFSATRFMLLNALFTDAIIMLFSNFPKVLPVSRLKRTSCFISVQSRGWRGRFSGDAVFGIGTFSRTWAKLPTSL